MVQLLEERLLEIPGWKFVKNVSIVVRKWAENVERCWYCVRFVSACGH